MGTTFKDTFTNYLAIVLVILGALNTYLQANAGKSIDWGQLVMFVAAAVISWFTGKDSTGKASMKEIDPKDPPPGDHN